MSKKISISILFLIVIILGSSQILSGQALSRSQRSGESITRDKLLQEYLDKQDEAEQDKLLEEMKAKGQIERQTADYSSPEMYDDTLRYQDILPDSLSDSLLVDEVLLDTIPDTTLKPFGFDLFDNFYDESVMPPTDVANIEDYILGPGDNLLIYLWGKVEKEYQLTIDRQGNIFIPKVGETTAWGMTIEEFESKIKDLLSKVYTDFQTSVSLGKIRSIRVYLTGEVKKPGAYTASSLTTLFNALYLADGPNDRGSLRQVKLIKDGKTFKVVDLYKFLLEGDSQGDIRLSSGDAVFVPVSGPRVTVIGEIKRPAIYELVGNEKVADVLKMAGGPTSIAFMDRVKLDRLSPDNERIVIDLNMNPNNSKGIDNIVIQGGDILTLYPRYEGKMKVVSIGGMVKQPQQFERTDSTSLLELVQRCELLPSDVYYERANLFRFYPNKTKEIIPINLNDLLDGQINIPLQDRDSLHIYSMDVIKRHQYVYIDGEILYPNEYPYYENMSIIDLIFLAGGLGKNAYQLNVELARTDYLGKVTTQLIDITDPESEKIKLREDDHVFIRKVPNWFVHHLATIEGEVKFPGDYALLSRQETLYSMLRRVGGFTDRAFPTGIIFQRTTIGESLIRQNLPKIIENSQPLKEDSLGNIKKLEFIKFSADNVNRIIIDISKLMSTGGKEGDITLQNGDYIYVPEIPSGISVMGAVGAEGTIKYDEGKKVRYYITRAGSLGRQADKKAMKLIKADGKVFAGRGTLGKRVDLGDAIVVPTAIKKDRDWLKIISQVVTITGGLLTSVFIIDKL
ncbi:MAG: hypothetical protein GY865_01635 [candidate division Zixibacteria bacterium]|nr:hypothetical protein [candidate division Zixibacteria bacterium]